jgi:hypothetical protein
MTPPQHATRRFAGAFERLSRWADLVGRTELTTWFQRNRTPSDF